VLLTDIEMPRLDGLSLCKRVKIDHKLPIPVIIFSSLVNEQLGFKCESVGADANVSKPESERLIGLIDELALKRPATG
jgi:two-component system chemotaxis response regulator CheV